MMKKLKIIYICFAGYSHLDWGGALETLQELMRRGHDVTVLSGKKIEAHIREKKLFFYDIRLDNFRPRAENESIEDTLAYHQFHNFFDVDSIVDSFKKGIQYILKNKVDIILSDPLCKIGPLISMKTGIPYVVMGPYNFKTEGRVEEDNNSAINKFIAEFKSKTEKLGIKDGHRLPLVQNSPWLNIVFSTPDFDRELQEPNITHVGADILFSDNQVKSGEELNVFYSSGTIFWDSIQIRAVSGLAKTYPIKLFITKGKIMPEIKEEKNLKVFEFCDDKKIIPQMDVLISQGGLGTVTIGIRSGVPMIVLPLFWYNMPQAIKVSRYGNGLSLNSLDDQVKKIGEAFQKITSDDSYKEKAVKIQKEFASYGGSKKAADLICGLIK